MKRTPQQVVNKHISKQLTDNGCWLWWGLMTNGTPRIGYKKGDPRRGLARIAVLMAYGLPIPEGKNIIATCGNPRCVKPEHVIGIDKQPMSRKRRRALWFSKHTETKDRVDAIIDEYKRGVKLKAYVRHKFSLEAIGEKYGISRQRVYQILWAEGALTVNDYRKRLSEKA